MALPVCEICGATVPPGKKLCWCCEHGPKLHPTEKKKEECSDHDACEIHFDNKEVTA